MKRPKSKDIIKADSRLPLFFNGIQRSGESRFGLEKDRMGKLCLLFLISALFYIACFNPFAPKLTQSIESADLIVTQQKNPEEVLQNFKVSYIFRDSLLYSDLLDTAFLFVYYDPDAGSSGRLVSWNRETDLRTTGRLFRHFQVIDLVWHSTIYENIEEEYGEISKQFDLTLISEEADYHVTGRAVFMFRKSWDEKWRITQWKDESEL